MEKARPGLLIILSGPSGVGKGTIRHALMRDESLNLVYSISITTRTPRNSEVDQVDYIFTSKHHFLDEIAKGNLLEWAEFVGNYYGTPRHFVDENREQGRNVLLEIEVEGAKQVLDKYQDDERVISIFIVPPSLDSLVERIKGRHTESENIILERLEKARKEINLQENYDYIVINDDVQAAIKEISSIIKARM
ncbi:MAG: guanylate kinase [Erysipelotrichaceae bacterium]|jgi:guanylate kinase|nr:guanylate kinase [Erysipelotrichaceae bacterium]